MTIYVGGLRDRLIRESVYQQLKTSLTALGWFDPTRKHQAVTFNSTAIEDGIEVQFNTAAISDETVTELDDELGSLFAEHRWQMYVDFYGETDAVSLHFTHDVKAILGGRMPSIGRSRPSIPVYDYTLATPPLVFYVEIENIVIDRAHNFPHPWQRHWYAVRFDIVDHYGTESDS